MFLLVTIDRVFSRIFAMKYPRRNDKYACALFYNTRKIQYLKTTCVIQFQRPGAVSSDCFVITVALSFFVLPEPKMEAERGSAVKTAYGMATAIL